MPKWLYDDDDEDEDFRKFEKIKRGQRRTVDDKQAPKKPSNVKHVSSTEK